MYIHIYVYTFEAVHVFYSAFYLSGYLFNSHSFRPTQMQNKTRSDTYTKKYL